MRCAAAVLVLAALVSRSASGLEISYLAQPPFAGSSAPEQILLQGEIVPGDFQRFVAFIRRDPDRFLRQTHITMASPGGGVVEAVGGGSGGGPGACARQADAAANAVAATSVRSVAFMIQPKTK